MRLAAFYADEIKTMKACHLFEVFVILVLFTAGMLCCCRFSLIQRVEKYFFLISEHDLKVYMCD